MYYSMFIIINQHQIIRLREIFLKTQLASLVQQLTRTRTLQNKKNLPNCALA